MIIKNSKKEEIHVKYMLLCLYSLYFIENRHVRTFNTPNEHTRKPEFIEPITSAAC